MHVLQRFVARRDAGVREDRHHIGPSEFWPLADGRGKNHEDDPVRSQVAPSSRRTWPYDPTKTFTHFLNGAATHFLGERVVENGAFVFPLQVLRAVPCHGGTNVRDCFGILSCHVPRGSLRWSVGPEDN